MEDKLDRVISLVTNLNEKFETLENKFDNLSKKMETFEVNVNLKFVQIDNEPKSKAPLEHCNELQQKILTLEEQLDELNSDLKKDTLMKESYDERLNFVIRGLRESDSPWKKKR